MADSQTNGKGTSERKLPDWLTRLLALGERNKQAIGRLRADLGLPPGPYGADAISAPPSEPVS